jgi:hypothetical protein
VEERVHPCHELRFGETAVRDARYDIVLPVTCASESESIFFVGPGDPLACLMMIKSLDLFGLR